MKISIIRRNKIVCYIKFYYIFITKPEMYNDSFLSIVKKYTKIPELTSEIVHEFIDRIIVHEAESSGKRIQEIEIIYNHIGVFDRSKVNVYMEKAV